MSGGRFMMRLYLDCFIVSLCLLDIYHVANLNITPCEIFRDGCVTEGCQYGVLDRFNENGEAIRSEERRVGKEGRARWWREQEKKRREREYDERRCKER